MHHQSLNIKIEKKAYEMFRSDVAQLQSVVEGPSKVSELRSEGKY